MENRPDSFCVSARVLGKWEDLSQHATCSEAIAEANELNRIVIGLPVRVIQSGRIVYELAAQTDESCVTGRM